MDDRGAAEARTGQPVLHEPGLRPTLLAADIVEAIIEGRQPEQMRLGNLLEVIRVE